MTAAIVPVEEVKRRRREKQDEFLRWADREFRIMGCHAEALALIQTIVDGSDAPLRKLKPSPWKKRVKKLYRLSKLPPEQRNPAADVIAMAKP